MKTSPQQTDGNSPATPLPWENMLPLVPTKINSPKRLSKNRAFMFHAVNSHAQLAADRAELIAAMDRLVADVEIFCLKHAVKSKPLMGARALLTRMEATPKQEQQAQ